MSRLIASNWFLLALVVCYTSGHFGSQILQPLAEKAWLRSAVVMVVMWAMGVTLDADQIKRSTQKPLASLLAIGSNVCVVPLCCASIMGVLAWLIGGSAGTEMAGGLFVAGLVPCTLASASVWTRKAGGDDSISMICTVVTNLACLAVVPLGIQVVLAVQTRVSPLAQMEKLAWFVVLPLIVAQLMRRYGAASWADRNKLRLSRVAQTGILVMVVFGAVASHQYTTGQGRGVSWSAVGWVIVAASAVHLTVMWGAIAVARLSGLSREEQIAVGISGSQKTLMVGLQIAIDCGVSVLPMMIYHGGQLILDTLVAKRWNRPRER
ncbi:MAG: bile acid:sodium symporter [Planctomycetota bacterium]